MAAGFPDNYTQLWGHTLAGDVLDADTVYPSGVTAESPLEEVFQFTLESAGDSSTASVYGFLKETGGAINPAILADIGLGDYITTAAYWENTDLGAATYRVVAAATGTDDGGSYLDAGSFQLEAVFGGSVDVTQFGAKGDAATDDTSRINAAEAFVSSRLGGILRFPAVEGYLCGSTVTKSPRTIWEGEGTRYISSAEDPKDSFSSRLVAGFDGSIVALNGPGIRQRGQMRHIQVFGDTATYPNAIAIDADELDEFLFHDVLISNFDIGFNIVGGSSTRFYEVYTSGCTVGLYMEDHTDPIFAQSQFAGSGYGAHLFDVSAINSVGVRWQSSGIANLFLDQCGQAAIVGGFSDSSDDGLGLWIRDCSNIDVNGILYYSNEDDGVHCQIEATSGEICRGIQHVATYFSGSASTDVGVHFVNNSGFRFEDIMIGGNFRGCVEAWTGTAPTRLTVQASVDAAAVYPEDVEFQGDVGFYGTTPVAQQTGVAVDAAGIHAALVNLGLITA